MKKLKIAVVGAGVGGLAIAARLAHRGHAVRVFEKTERIGGRNHEATVGSCLFDGGPTLVMMLDPFRRLFADLGESIEGRLPMTRLDPCYRARFADGAFIDATTDASRMIRQIAKLSSQSDADGFQRLLADISALYQDSIPAFVDRNFDSILDFVNLRSIRLIAKHRLLSNFSRRMEYYVHDPRLKMLFSFQTMYLGLSPFDALWVYAILTHLEFGAGIWYPDGGVRRISQVIADLAMERGATLEMDSEAVMIEGGRIMFNDGSAEEADVVICNADLPYAERSLLSQPKRRRHSCSCVLAHFDYDGKIDDLQHHNVFFCQDFKRNLDQIFHRFELPENPSFYVCNASKTDARVAPKGRSAVSVLLPCPNLTRPWKDGDTERLLASALDRLRSDVGFEPAKIKASATIDPTQWEREFNLDAGAAFGLSHDLFQSAYFRPSNRSKSVSGLYFVGASTVPGNGLPMVLISAELAERRLIEEMGA